MLHHQLGAAIGSRQSAVVIGLDVAKASPYISRETVQQTISELLTELLVLTIKLYARPTVHFVEGSTRELDIFVQQSGVTMGCPLSVAMFAARLRRVLDQVLAHVSLLDQKVRLLPYLKALCLMIHSQFAQQGSPTSPELPTASGAQPTDQRCQGRARAPRRNGDRNIAVAASAERLQRRDLPWQEARQRE